MKTNNENQLYILAFSQNQREEVRDLRDTATSLTAERGSHHQTFILCKYQSNSKTYNK